MLLDPLSMLFCSSVKILNLSSFSDISVAHVCIRLVAFGICRIR